MNNTEDTMDTINPMPLGQIGAALAKAQAEMENPRFDRENPHFRNRFASLAAVRDAVVPVFARHGISCLQNVSTVERGVACVTILVHASGQTLASDPLIMPVAKADAQGFGSAATYARRYQLMAFACVVGDEDDDANAASGKPVASVAIDPRPDTSHVDPAAIEKYVSRAQDIVDADYDEAQIDAAIYGLHHDLATQHDVYVAVADALAARKIIAKAAWKQAIGRHKQREAA